MPASVQPGETEPTKLFGTNLFVLVSPCQIENALLELLNQSKSSCPGIAAPAGLAGVCPKKSPTPASVQPGETEPTKLFGVKPLPVESQMLNAPVVLLNQSRPSWWLSPLVKKSPMPARLQPGSTEPIETFWLKPVPVVFACHSVNAFPFCQIRSPLPSPLKSPRPANVQAVVTEPST